MTFDIVTIFPEFFRGPLDFGILRRAREAGLVEVSIHDLRDYTHDRHRTVDDRPFGGGEGMVLKPEPIFECCEKLGVAPLAERASGKAKQTVALLSPQGPVFNQTTAAELAGLERIVLICGRYEGVDERVSQHLCDREISLGDFVLSGGEIGAALIVDAVTRLLPGALGHEDSNKQESFTSGVAGMPQAEGEPPSSTCGSGGLLDYPHYTRPGEFRGWAVPEVLANGNHTEIRKWRRRQALQKTLRNRPDLLEEGALSEDDRAIVNDLRAEKADPSLRSG
jgi:tRNA (guanine37-N1)-methyltransferase